MGAKLFPFVTDEFISPQTTSFGLLVFVNLDCNTRFIYRLCLRAGRFVLEDLSYWSLIFFITTLFSLSRIELDGL